MSVEKIPVKYCYILDTEPKGLAEGVVKVFYSNVNGNKDNVVINAPMHSSVELILVY